MRQLLSNGIISIDFIKSTENIVDLLTKGLSREKVNCSSRGIRLKPMTKKFPGWQPNLVDWRSQDLGLKGQPNHGD